jgi:hypothetical protein
MSVMPGAVAKPPILEELDAISKDKTRFEAMFADLKNAPATVDGIIKVAWNHQIIKTNAEEQHLRNHWFGDWWQNHTKKPAVVKHGLLKACELAIDQQKALDGYWVCSGDLFQVFSTTSSQQVTVMVLTPPPPSVANTKYPDLEDIYAAKEKPPSLPPGQKELSAADGVHVVRFLKDESLP